MKVQARVEGELQGQWRIRYGDGTASANVAYTAKTPEEHELLANAHRTKTSIEVEIESGKKIVKVLG